MKSLEVKICGCRRPADAIAAVEAGAAHYGLVFAERVRRITPDEAARIVEVAGTASTPVGVFVDASVDHVLAARDTAGFRIAQLHGDEPPEQCDALRVEGLGVWKAIRPRDEAELRQKVAEFAGTVDGILVEGFSSKAPGGTGTGFPHAWLEGSAEPALWRPGDGPRSDRAVLILAGGLTPEGVGDAVREVNPAIVDVSSGVERAPGVKDRGLIRRFVANALAAVPPTAGAER